MNSAVNSAPPSAPAASVPSSVKMRRLAASAKATTQIAPTPERIPV
jgi:hypothetical protein